MMNKKKNKNNNGDCQSEILLDTKQQIMLTNDNFIPYNEYEQRLNDLENLHNDLKDLNEIIICFNTTVKQQGEQIKLIQDNIEETHINVKQGTHELKNAEKMSGFTNIVIGSTIGGLIVGGPIGGLIGLKAGAVVGTIGCVGGLIIGATTGGYVGKVISKIERKISGSFNNIK